MQTTENIETVRARYRPDRITTLFVGESAPASGEFFYLGGSAMLSHMQRAVGQARQTDQDFLQCFKDYGWYLDDLVLEPVNHLTKSERAAKCMASRESLAGRIAEYRPLAIVSLLISIKNIVYTAADLAGSNAPRFTVPFPGMGQQTRFQTVMTEIIPKLPRE